MRGAPFKLATNVFCLDLGAKCHHMHFFGQCKLHEATNFCEVGRRSRTYFVLSGSVISVWPLLETVLSGSRRSSRMQIVRIRTDDNQKIVGRFPQM